MTTPTAYVQHLTLSASPAAVCTALSTPEGVSRWWGSTTGAGGPGGTLEVRFPGSADPLVLRVTDADGPGVVRWVVEECAFLAEWVGTAPTFSITARDDGGSDLTFTHHGLTPHLDCYDKCSQDWSLFLTRHLAPALEGGGAGA